MPRAKRIGKAPQIEEVTAKLFGHKGYDSTSMREIAGELGMNPSSLYYYFKSKENILFKLMNDAMDDALAVLVRICAADLIPEEKLRRLLRFYTRYYAGDQERLILLVNETNALNVEHRRILVQKQRNYVQLIRSVLEELAAAGKTREIDPTAATFAFFGMVHYTIKWYRQDGPIDLDRLAEIFVEIFTRGILR